jgi:hypothetical protein
MDVLTDVLNALELKGQITARRALVPPWRYNFPFISFLTRPSRIARHELCEVRPPYLP